MAPLKHSSNFAARMGRWSARHRKLAIFGWLAFVIASVVIGGAVGTKYLEPHELNVGEAKKADKLIEDAGFNRNDEQTEFVLVQSKTLTTDDPAELEAASYLCWWGYRHMDHHLRQFRL